MERRLSISQKRCHSRYDSYDSDPPSQHQQHFGAFTDTAAQTLMSKLRTPSDLLLNSDRQPRSRSSSNDRRMRTSKRIFSRSGTPVPQDVPPESQSTATIVASANSGKRNSKRKLQNEVIQSESTPKKKKAKQTEIRTKVEYVGLDLPVPKVLKELANVIQPHNSDSNNRSSNHLDVVGNSMDLASSGSLSSSSCNVSVQGSEGGRSLLNGTEEVIAVPSWRTSIVKMNEVLDSDEIEVREVPGGGMCDNQR